MSRSEQMSQQECRDALQSQYVGRMAVQTADGPHVVPVNYAVLGDRIYFRVQPASVLGQHLARGVAVAFEIDDVTGTWSVVARGGAAHAPVLGDDAVKRLRTRGIPAPWPGPHGRELYELTWRELTGRRRGGGIRTRG